MVNGRILISFLRSIGTAAMIDLLTLPSLFLSVGNDCWSQLTGKPISDLNVPSVSSHTSELSSTMTGNKRSTAPSAAQNRVDLASDPPTKRPRLAQSARAQGELKLPGYMLDGANLRVFDRPE
jgi:hypothetical protein